jgi:hypothetical protein
MNTKDNDPLHAAINAKLASLVAASSTPPAWYESWHHLGPQSADEERLAVYRTIRDAGFLPEDAGFYLVSWQVDAMTSRHAEVALRELDDQLKAIERAHGVAEGEMWEPGAAPAEYEEVRLRYQHAWDAIFGETLDVLCFLLKTHRGMTQRDRGLPPYVSKS